MAFDLHTWALNSDSDMHALQSMQWKKSTPKPRPRLRSQERSVKMELVKILLSIKMELVTIKQV
jgi:hypothetical protein